MKQSINKTTKTNVTDQDAVLFKVTEQGIAYVTLNKPNKFNAFDEDMIAQLTSIFTEIADREDIRIMVLSSTGKHFCAGADLTWMQRMADYSYQNNLADANALASMLEKLNFLPQTSIVKIQGISFGGAVGLASCCDIVLATEQTSFCLSEVKLGLIPATISPYVLNAIGLKAARRYFQSAERFSAQKAQQLGLVDEIVALDQLDEVADNMIKQILGNGPEAVRHAKKLALDLAYQKITPALSHDTSERIAQQRVSAEGQEGLKAFFDKRAPNWQPKQSLTTKE